MFSLYNKETEKLESFTTKELLDMMNRDRSPDWSEYTKDSTLQEIIEGINYFCVPYSVKRPENKSSQKIRNMRVVSDDPSLLHFTSSQPIALGTVEEHDGKKYRVIDNMQLGVVVTLEPVEPENLYTLQFTEHHGDIELWKREGYELIAMDPDGCGEFLHTQDFYATSIDEAKKMVLGLEEYQFNSTSVFDVLQNGKVVFTEGEL